MTDASRISLQRYAEGNVDTQRELTYRHSSPFLLGPTGQRLLPPTLSFAGERFKVPIRENID